MAIHSKFLIHWTGNNKNDIEHETVEIKKQKLYLDRLLDYYQNGLYTKRTTENILRTKEAPKKVVHWKIKKIVRLCFTEIRLSQAKTHADHYGKLGIGFTRDFIMDKGGRPVIYVPYNANNRLLEESIKNIYEKSKENTEIHKSAKWIFAHVKSMTDKYNYDCYEEMEWRLVYDEKADNKHFTKKSNGVYRLKFSASDIKIIVFPDENTKKLALENDVMKKYFSEHIPIMVTLDDCLNF